MHPLVLLVCKWRGEVISEPSSSWVKTNERQQWDDKTTPCRYVTLVGWDTPGTRRTSRVSDLWGTNWCFPEMLDEFFYLFIYFNLIEELREKSNPGLTPRQVSDWQEGFSLRWAACGDMLKAQHACAELMALCVKRTFDGFTHQIATFYQLDSVWQQLTSMWTDSSYQPTRSNSAQRVWMWRLTLWWHYARKISRCL